jgi:hypothetical protein
MDLGEEIVKKTPKEVPVADRPADRALEFDSDQELEADLRRELLEIAQSNGTSDPRSYGTLPWRIQATDQQAIKGSA